MKFANDYLKELLGVQVCKLEFNLSHNDRWEYGCSKEPHMVNGRICMSISFESNAVVTSDTYGSLMVTLYINQLDQKTHYYEIECLYGKETTELISYLGGRDD